MRADVATAAGSSGSRRITRGWLAMMAAAFLALALQSLVVQTHVHLEHAAAASLDANAPDARLARHGVPPPTPLDCPTCRQLAHAGDYLFPPAVALAILGAAPAWRHDPTLPLQRGHRRSHGWRSRGPPSADAAARS